MRDAPPTPHATAFEAIKAWQDSPGLHLLHEGPALLDKLERLCARARIAGGKVHDARIAATCLNRGVAALWTADRDFSLFPELKTRNPLLQGSVGAGAHLSQEVMGRRKGVGLGLDCAFRTSVCLLAGPAATSAITRGVASGSDLE